MTVIGIDVSKQKLDCAWLKEESSGKVKCKVFANTAPGHQALMDWSMTQTGLSIGALHFVMEATSVYHESLAHHLFKAGAKVSVVNPARIKSYAKSLGVQTKTDKKDSAIVARYGVKQAPRLWRPEAGEVKQLKALLGRLSALEKDIQRERNRVEKIQASVNTAIVLKSIQGVLAHLEKEKQRIEQQIHDHIDQHPDLKQDRELLKSIPGIGPVLSRLMLTLIRSRDFQRASQCAAFVGLVPVHRESGSSVRGRPRLSKAGNSQVRAKLYMAAVSAIQHNPDVKALYQRLVSAGKSKMSALCAAMRKLVHICFGVLKHQTTYQPQVAISGL